MTDYSKMNPNDFTQKDLMLHLLQVSQHTVTREEVKEDISALDNKLDKLESKFEVRFDKINEKFDKINEKFDKIDKKFEKINEKFDKVDGKFEKVYDKISKVDAKFDKIQWLLIATLFTVVFKDYIVSFF